MEQGPATPLLLLSMACSRVCMQACPGICQALPCTWQGEVLRAVLQSSFRGMSAALGIIASTLTPHLAKAAPHRAKHAVHQPRSHHAAPHSPQEGVLDSAGVPCGEVIDLNPFCETPAPDGAKHTLKAVIFYHNRHYIACCRHGERWVAYNDNQMYILPHVLVRLADWGAPGLPDQQEACSAAPRPCLPARWSAWLSLYVCAPQHLVASHALWSRSGLLNQPAGGPTRDVYIILSLMLVDMNSVLSPWRGLSRASPKGICFKLFCSQQCALAWSLLPGHHLCNVLPPTLGPAGHRGDGGRLAGALSHVRAPGEGPIQVSAGRLSSAVNTCKGRADICIKGQLAAGRLPGLLLVPDSLRGAHTQLYCLCM